MTCGAVLSIDTASDTCSVAVRSSEGRIVESHSDGSGDHFEKLSLLIEQALHESKTSVSELSLIRVGLGPGSFTGLRIGVSFCKGLACAYRIPLVGVCSFEALAYSALQQGVSGILAIASDARRDEVFCAAYDLDPVSGGVVCVKVPHIAPTSDFVANFITGAQKAHLVTPMKSFVVAGKQLESVHRVALGGLYAQAAPTAFSSLSISELEPNYLRAVAAKTIEERRLGA